MSAHSSNFHLSCANKLCRVCSNRVEKFERGACRAKACAVYAAKLLSVFAIDTSCDIKGVQSEYFCSKCYYTLVNAPRQPGEVTDYVRPEEKKEYDSINQCWKPWMETVSLSECWSCSKFTSQGRGRRPPKRKRQARTVAATTKDTEGQGRCDTLNTQCSTSGQFERTEQDTLPVPPSSPSQSVSCSDS